VLVTRTLRAWSTRKTPGGGADGPRGCERVFDRATMAPMSVVARHPSGYRPDSYQPSLFGLDDPAVDSSFRGIHRTWLDDDSWVDHVPRWLRGADIVFGELVARLPWAHREVVMYDRVVPEPRLTAWWDVAARTPEPLPALTDARAVLTRHYERPFDSIGFNLYRDGRDSVAWHADRERFEHEDPTVVIVSVGSPRAFQIRRRRPTPADPTAQREPSRTWLLGHGDLLVMGGACQHDWEHRVPKTAHADGPRLSIMFRHHLARDVDRVPRADPAAQSRDAGLSPARDWWG
jgi:alkylated DNA repair dioxygenase AlkB